MQVLLGDRMVTAGPLDEEMNLSGKCFNLPSLSSVLIADGSD